MSLGRLGAVLIVAVVLWDRLRGDRGLLHEAPPDWSSVYLGRTAILAVAATMIVWSLRRSVRSSVASTDPCHQVGALGTGSTVVIVLGNLTALIAAGLVIVAPSTLTRLVTEDGVVEWSSAIIAFVGSGFFAAAAWLYGHRREPTQPWWVVAVPTVASIVCLLIGLEEVSWFQRVLEIESPTAVQSRNQPEFNLHNGATDLSENLYYLGGFVITVGVPALLGDRTLRGRYRPFEVVIPSRAPFYSSAAASAVVYEMWNVVGIQLVLFLTLALLATEPPEARRQSGAILAVVILVAGVFLGFGSTMTRSWDDTEIRELLLPLGLAVYGFDVMRRTSALSSSRYTSVSHLDDGRSWRSSAQVTRR